MARAGRGGRGWPLRVARIPRLLQDRYRHQQRNPAGIERFQRAGRTGLSNQWSWCLRGSGGVTTQLGGDGEDFRADGLSGITPIRPPWIE